MSPLLAVLRESLATILEHRFPKVRFLLCSGYRLGVEQFDGLRSPENVPFSPPGTAAKSPSSRHPCTGSSRLTTQSLSAMITMLT